MPSLLRVFLPDAEAWQRMSLPEYADSMREAQQTFDSEMSGRSTGVSSAPKATR